MFLPVEMVPLWFRTPCPYGVKIALLEAKAKQAEQAGDIAEDTRLTPEEKEQKLRAIFGLS